MKKMFLVICIMLLMSSVSWAIETHVSTNTVSINSAVRVVSFTSVINKIFVLNESSSVDVYVRFSDLAWQTTRRGHLIYVSPNTTDFKLAPSSSISLDVKTNYIGFIRANLQSGDVQYIATSDLPQQSFE